MEVEEIIMAFRLDLTEPLPDTLRRLAERQIAKVRAGLARPDGIHETRKSIKKLRAIGHLLGPVREEPALRRFDRTLRDLGRALSARRDADVEAGVWRDVLQEANITFIALPAAVHHGDRNDSVAAPLPPVRLLAAAERQSKQLPFNAIDERALVASVARTYREGRRWRRRAIRKDTSVAFHDWRKRVQRHMRHLQLLQEIWPEAAAARVALARTLSATVGDEHDLHLLAMRLEAASGLLSDAERARAEAVIARRRDALRVEARRLGRRLYAEQSKAFRRRFAIELRTSAPSIGAFTGSTMRQGRE
jgi:hypothetical protein